MKAKTSFIALVLCVALLPVQSAMSQSIEMRPRRISAATAASPYFAPTTLDSMVSRDGLAFYVEVRNGGLAELARSAGTLAPLSKMIATGKSGLTSGDLAGFVMAHFASLSSSRLAVAGYGSRGAAILIEAASSAEADKLGADISRLLLAGSPGKPDAAEMDVSVQGQIVTAGARRAVALLTEGGGSSTLADDQEFQKARARFGDDSFFAFVELGAAPMPWPASVDAAQDSAYMAGALAAMNGMPYAVAMGGSLEANMASLRALLLFSRKQKNGIFSSLLASTRTGTSAAESFAASDTDLFVDVMLDWEKVYDLIQSFFLTMASQAMKEVKRAEDAQALQYADPLAMLEESLGFSIKDDLLPTLGSEIALSMSNFDNIIAPAARSAGARSKARQPRFMLMLALKDPIKFEKLMGRMLGSSGRAVHALAEARHRGARIHYRSGIAYTVSSGFLIVGASINEIRRALDARALGTSLASSPEFRSTMGPASPAMMQVFVSSRVSGKLQEFLQAEAAKIYPAMAGASAAPRAPLGVAMKHDADGMMLEMRVPVSFAFMALNSMASGSQAGFGSGYNPASGSGMGRRRTPRLTDEDLRNRRP